VSVGDQLNIQVNLPGNQIFSNSTSDVLGSLNTLATALQGGSASDISTATAAVSTALNYVSQQRVFYGNAESQLTSQDAYLQQETVTLASQQNSLVGVDLAKAADPRLVQFRRGRFPPDVLRVRARRRFCAEPL